MELFEDGIGTGRDNKDEEGEGEGERTGDARFQLRGGSCSLAFAFTVGDVESDGTGTGRSSGDDDGERVGDGLFKSFDTRGGGGGGGARLAGSLRSEEDVDARSWIPSATGRFN